MPISRITYQQRTLSHVKRWAILPHTTPQSVADHSYYVALYTSAICEILNIPPHIERDALKHALVHDMEEVFTNDLPSPFKPEKPEYHKVHQMLTYLGVTDFYPIGDVARGIVKIADLLDSYVWLELESIKGNDSVKGQMPSINDPLGDAVQAVAEFMKANEVCRSWCEDVNASTDRLRQFVLGAKLNLEDLRNTGYQIPKLEK